MSVITRFAPSPTGFLHIGNIRTALVCYLYAKQQGGKFMLRLDDTDIERSEERFAVQGQADLKWLGLEWDTFARQSDRMARYDEIKQKLIADGRLYPCYETEEELEIKRKTLLGRGLPPIYDRAALKLSDAQKKEYEAQGRNAHWRFKLDESAPIQWNDQIKGKVHFEAKNLSDPVLIRANGAPTYMLPSAIDDMDFAITHVVRGEDHVSNTAIQIQLFQAMGSHIPTFAHLSLMKSKEGKISKRLGGFEIMSLRDEGIEALTILSFMSRLGTSEPIEPRTSLSDIISHFDLSTFGKAPAIYDYEELAKFNAKVVHALSYAHVKDRPDMAGIDEDFYAYVQPNLERLKDIRVWWSICKEPLAPLIDNLGFTKQASTLLPEGTWDDTTWHQWTESVKIQTGHKGKDLFMPLRKALTGLDHGPELKHILPLIGREKAHARLNGQKA